MVLKKTTIAYYQDFIVACSLSLGTERSNAIRLPTMPRLPRSLLSRAYRISPLLPPLLRTTRTLDSARQELRWLRAAASSPQQLARLVHRRGTLCEPLQYVLGTQPFGATEILCRRGVLVPRAETEELAVRLAALLPGRGTARVVDLCTGSGCIALLLAAARADAHVVGVDVCRHALALALRNRAHNAATLRGRVAYVLADVLDRRLEGETAYQILACLDEMDGAPSSSSSSVDVVVSNPPYITASGYARETERSVRLWEPRLALEAGPGGDDQHGEDDRHGGDDRHDGDAFYPRVASLARALGARAVVAEVGGWQQAARVQRCWERSGWLGTVVWPDFAGRGRAVAGWRAGGEWVGGALQPS